MESLQKDIIDEWVDNGYCCEELAQPEIDVLLGQLVDQADLPCLRHIQELSEGTKLCQTGLVPLLRFLNLLALDQESLSYCSLLADIGQFPKLLKQRVLSTINEEIGKQVRGRFGLQTLISEKLKRCSTGRVQWAISKTLRHFSEAVNIQGPVLDYLVYHLGLESEIDLMAQYLVEGGSLKPAQGATDGLYSTQGILRRLDLLESHGKLGKKRFIKRVVKSPAFATFANAVLGPKSPYYRLEEALNEKGEFDRDRIYPKLVAHQLPFCAKQDTPMCVYLLNAHLGLDDDAQLAEILRLVMIYFSSSTQSNDLEALLCRRPHLSAELVRIYRKMRKNELTAGPTGEQDKWQNYSVFDEFDEVKLKRNLCLGMDSLEKCLNETIALAKKQLSSRATQFQSPASSTQAKQCSSTAFVLQQQLNQDPNRTIYLAYRVEDNVPLLIQRIPSWIVGPNLEAVKREEEFMHKASNHPHVAPLLCTFSQLPDGHVNFVMPYYSQGSLGDRLRRGHRLEPAQALKFTRQLLSALAFLHRQGIAHLNVKPDNVFLDGNDGDDGGKVILTDFKWAASINPSTGLVSSQEMSQNSVEYMPPETHLEGIKSPANDYYALGITLHELVTGSKPYLMHSPLAPEADSVNVVANQLRQKGLELATGIDESVGQMVKKLTAIDPEERNKNVADLIRKGN